MQKRFASRNVASVIWYMPTALDAGRYTSKGFQVSCHRQYVRATGFPAPSTCASAARSSGVMTGVECSRKSGPYCRQVSNGVFASVPLTGKNSSVGLRTTWYTQLVADQTRRMAMPAMSNRAQGGAARNARSARRRARARGQTDAIRNRRTRAFRGRPALATAPYGTDLLCVHGW